MDEKRVADYFVISGISEKPEVNLESKPLINSVLPITDIAVIFRGLGEKCPIGYTCIESTPGGHVADLNNGNFKSPNIQICYRRGNDKPPLVDVGVYHEDKDRVLPDVDIVYTTPYGRCASTGTINSKSGTYITYRRAKTNSPFNQLVVVDLCVILNNKSEHPPHAFYSIKKNLNKSLYGMIGSEVFLCYKKTLLSPPSICYKPQIISRFPLQDYANFPLPDTVPLFCLPAGASIEVRPVNNPLPRPITSTFVLTSDSAQKIYGSAMTFYELFDDFNLTPDQKSKLGLQDSQTNDQGRKTHDTFTVKSICILSRWPFFDCFENFLTFLHRLVFNYSFSEANSPIHRKRVPLEHHISHFLLDVSFPTPQRPTVLVQLMPGTDETVTISQPFSRLPLPLTGASFIQLLNSLGVENTMNVLLFGLCEQKILLHSLQPWLLTVVAEAITAMLFPFHWQCPYVPLCPLSLHGILNAPLPFIVGIDSRCFDTFTPPDDIVCIDLDTNSIYLSELKKCLNLRILPKRAARVLRSSLEKIFLKCQRYQTLANQSPQHRPPGIDDALQKRLDLEIQEAFVRFMATILRGFRSFLLPITKAPTVGATDPTSLFNFEGFLMSRDRNYSQFYQLITKTQMFAHYIEERSFVSDKNTSLAFFDDCEEKLTSSDDIYSDRPIKLFDKDDSSERTDRSVYIPAPEQSPSISLSNSVLGEDQPDCVKKFKFGPLNAALFHRHPQVNNFPSIERALNESVFFDDNPNPETNLNEMNASFSISRRTKQEIKASVKMAKKSHDTPLDWSKYLVSCCYCLWFSTLPSYITYCKSINPDDQDHNSKSNARILRYAYTTIVKMQKLQLTADEICFRVLTLLCGYYGQPALAVRVFFEMKKAGIKPNAVTYGYYNRAVLESKWPDHSSKPTTVLWTKIRNVISGIALFKSHGRVRMERRNLKCIQLIGDPSFYRADTDLLEKTRGYPMENDLFKPTTLPVNRHLVYDSYDDDRNMHQHRRSLINRSFSINQESLIDVSDAPNDPSRSPRIQNHIHKSYSMHLRNGSPDRCSVAETKLIDDDEVDEPPIVQKIVNNLDTANTRRITSTNDLFLNLKERDQLFAGAESYRLLNENLRLIDSQAGLLFASNPSARKIASGRSSSHSPNLTDNSDPKITINNTTNSASNFLLDSNITESSQITDLLKTNSFGEDARILRKLEPKEPKPIYSDPTDFLQDDGSSEDTRSNQLSESLADPSEGASIQGDDSGLLKSITSTPNFKLSTILNDAGSLQWSKWTSSHNSKSVYKGIKSAATGIVSSLQEIKSSFSISNSNTPSKLLTAAHPKSATREMLSQWANSFYNTIQPSKGYDDDESDCSSAVSNDLLRLSNEEDIEPSAAEASDFRFCYDLFVALEKHYNNSSSKEDLVDHLSDIDSIDIGENIALEVKMTTCSRCNICSSLLYDEEIMVRWSHNESNLNTRCIYCRAKIVPMMSITVEDYRFTQQGNSPVKADKNETNDLVDLNFDETIEGRPATAQVESTNHKVDVDATSDRNKQSFTVPYLSPIVLRKELESVFESSGDICPSSSKFVDEHPIIYWNLLWYFSRINVPTHLGLLCLNSITILNGREVPEKWLKSNKVLVKTLWDNEKLHTGIGKPLYRQLERGDPSIQVRSILCDEIFFTRSLLEQVINLIRTNQLHIAMNLILNARLKSSTKFSFDKNRHNLYRDLIFLINKLGSGKLYMDNFEREYKKAFESLNFQQVALNRFDRPPTIGSLFCRKCFKELSLCDK